MSETPIICLGCGNRGKVARVTSDLTCSICKTGENLDIDDGQKTAASPGTGWTENRPNALQGWDEYSGPQVGSNPLRDTKLDSNSGVCPACGGSGKDTRASGGGYSENSCRLCGGSGRYTSPTSLSGPTKTDDAHTQGPNVGGARLATVTPLRITLPNGTKWEGTGRVINAGRTSTDPMGSVEQYNGDYNDSRGPATRPNHPNNGQVKLNAQCPSCGSSSTHLTRDHKDDGWWTCPKCGPLANVDRTKVNPYDPGFGFTPDRGMKIKGNVTAEKKTGQLFKMVMAIKENNSGLSNDEALILSRRALLKWGNN
jgi:ribosomal protein S27AE